MVATSVCWSGALSFRLRTGIAGAGVFGAHHAGKHAASDRAELVGVCDVDGGRAAALAERFGARAFADFDRLVDAVDAIVVAAPAPTHYALARRALERGRHVYVEKPLALSLRDADSLIALAEEKSLVLQVGHQERFVLDALGLPRREPPKRLEFSRCGPPSGRGEDVSVVFDLMIHDLDIARMFGFSRPRDIAACGDRDETIATLAFDGARRCSFIASRRMKARRRRMIAVYGDGAIEIDFAGCRVADSTPLACGGAAARAFADPLGRSVEAFFASILDGASTMVDGKAGRGALEWGLMVEAARDRLAAAPRRASRKIA
jgi:predicted dehydrogenase